MLDLFRRETKAERLAREAGGGPPFWMEILRAAAVFAVCLGVIYAGALAALLVFLPLFETTDSAFDFTRRFMQLPAIGILILYLQKIEKRPLPSGGLTKEKILRRVLVGAGLGAAAAAAAVLLGWAAGVYRGEGLSPWAHPLQWALLLFAFLIQSFFEEFFFRGVLLTGSAGRRPAWAAIAASSLLFALFRGVLGGFGVLSFLNALLFGVFACLYARREDGSVWGIALFRGTWSFVHGCLFGLHVAGSARFAAVWIFSQTGSSVLGGGAYGPEGGLLVTGVLSVGIGLLLAWDRLARKKRDLSSF